MKKPNKLLTSKYRKEMWKNVERTIKKIDSTMKISSIKVIGSFTTKKRRPADVDFLILLTTKNKKKNEKWSCDLVISPDNKYGRKVEEDALKWMKQKYGSNKFKAINLKWVQKNKKKR
jgi:hypothetical protein